jgi:hypothetical protein
MNQADFDIVVRDTIASIENLLKVKGGEYAGSEDRLANFKRGQQRTGAHPYQVLWIYLSKHIDSVETYIKDFVKGVNRPRSESIDGRLDDMINYCLLMKALIKENENALKAAPMIDKTWDGKPESQPQGESGKDRASMYGVLNQPYTGPKTIDPSERTSGTEFR